MLAGLTLYEREDGTAQMGGGQSGSISPNLLPKELILCQSYPNPAVRGLTIRYGIPRQSRVSLNLYDIGGKLVRTLESSDKAKPGYYCVNWNCQDNRNRAIANGVYFYRLEAADGRTPGTDVKTRKLVIAR